MKILRLYIFILLLTLSSVGVVTAQDNDAAEKLFAAQSGETLELAGWRLDTIEKNPAQIRSIWQEVDTGGKVAIVLMQHDKAVPCFGRTAYYNLFIETSEAGMKISDRAVELAEALLVHIRTREGGSGLLIKKSEWQAKEKVKKESLQKARVKLAKKKQLLARWDLRRLLPKGLQINGTVQTWSLFLRTALIFMLVLWIYAGHVVQYQLEEYLRNYMRDFLNRVFKFVITLQSTLTAMNFAPDELSKIVASPLVPYDEPWRALANIMVDGLTLSGPVSFLGTFGVMWVLYLLFFHSFTMFAFILFKNWRRSLMAIGLIFAFPWFMLPAETLIPALLFGWIFFVGMQCVVVQMQAINPIKSMPWIMAASCALAAWMHPLALLIMVFFVFWALHNPEKREALFSRPSNWLGWFFAILMIVPVLLQLQILNPTQPAGGIFAGGFSDLWKNLAQSRWLNLSVNTLPHMVLFVMGLLLALKKRAAADGLYLLAVLTLASFLLAALLPLSEGHFLISVGIVGLPAVFGAIALDRLWEPLDDKPISHQILFFFVIILFAWISPAVAQLTG